LGRDHWRSASPIRKIFREAFERAGLPYFNPHSFRNTLVQLGQEICQTPEEFKAWSQNLGHEQVLTTFVSYGEVTSQRQGEIIRSLATPQATVRSDVNDFAEAVVKKLRDSGLEKEVLRNSPNEPYGGRETKSDGNVKSEQVSVAGTADADQLTLKIGSGLPTVQN
jgi:hypothetical protein